MATGEFRLDPLDLEPNVAIGVDLPLIATTGTIFKQNYTTIDQARANAKNLLLTSEGERVMLPDFGCGLRRFVFELIQPNTAEKIKAKIISKFATWLPYLFINKAEVHVDPSNSLVEVSLEISLQSNKFDTRSIQLKLTQTS